MILFFYIMVYNIICFYKLIKVGWNLNFILSRFIFFLIFVIEKSNICIKYELNLYFKIFLLIIKNFVVIRINKNLNKFGNMLKFFKNRLGFW